MKLFPDEASHVQCNRPLNKRHIDKTFLILQVYVNGISIRHMCRLYYTHVSATKLNQSPMFESLKKTTIYAIQEISYCKYYIYIRLNGHPFKLMSNFHVYYVKIRFISSTSASKIRKLSYSCKQSSGIIISDSHNYQVNVTRLISPQHT